MGQININIDALVCEDPIFTSVTYTGTPYQFNLNWTSIGDYLSTFDSTVSMNIQIELFFTGQTTPYFVGNVSTPPPIPFDGTNFLINILDYDGSFLPKDRILFTLTMSGEDSCTNSTTYDIPGDTIPA